MQIYFTRWAKLSVSPPPVLPILMDLLQNFTWFVTTLFRQYYIFLAKTLCWSVIDCVLQGKGQIVLQQALSPVISPLLLLNAGSNSLYLHSFITLTLHLLKGAAMTTLESLYIAQILRLSIRPPTARCHTNTQTSSLLWSLFPLLTSHHFTDPGHTCHDILDSGAHKKHMMMMKFILV